MKVFEANITHQVSDFLNDNLKKITSFEKANQKMYDAFGIIHFFDNDEELETLKEVLSITHNIIEEPDRAEYGDFQTNSDLAFIGSGFKATTSSHPRGSVADYIFDVNGNPLSTGETGSNASYHGALSQYNLALNYIAHFRAGSSFLFRNYVLPICTVVPFKFYQAITRFYFIVWFNVVCLEFKFKGLHPTSLNFYLFI